MILRRDGWSEIRYGRETWLGGIADWRLVWGREEHPAVTFTHALRLPTFETSGMTLTKRLTLILRGSVIEYVFYPVGLPARPERR